LTAALLAELAAIVAPIFIAAGVGYAWARSGRPYDGIFVRRVVMNIGTPCLIVSTIGRAEVATPVLLTSALACWLVVALTLLVFGLVLRLGGLDRRVFLPPLVFANTGNMGLPLALFAFGQEGLALALGFFIAMTFAHFTIGIYLTAGRANLGEMLRTPILHAAYVALFVQLSGVSVPAWLDNTLDLIGGITIPLMLITLGVSLASIQVATLGRTAALALLRLGGGVLAGWLVASMLGLEGMARAVVILQSAMPAAVFNYLLAQQFGRSPADVAGLVVVSTLLSFLTLPLLLWWLL
jgi:malate permease and related proteins